MSGIVGIYSLGGRPVDRTDAERMLASIAHRGPDGGSLWCEETVGLGHRMLHTTPESLVEMQPLSLDSTDRARPAGLRDGAFAHLVLTADARVDNRDDLIRSLGMTDRPAGELSDAELILRAYARWGDACPERLIGDFAFAIWDGRRRTLFCARDPMGVKPFYYHHAPGRLFCFASEIKALLCLPEVPRKLNELQVAFHIERIVDDREITFYEGIQRLPAASAMRVNVDGRRIRRYWEPDTHREIRLSSDEEYAEAFREVFEAAVRSQLRSAFPVGSTLSGGLDSSSIACVARDALREGGRRLHTFSAVFPGLPEPERKLADESRYIDAVLETGGMEPHRIRLDELGPLDDLDRVLEEQDEAHIVVNHHMHRALFRAAAQAGVRVFLDGTDGDTTVSHGFGRLDDLAIERNWEAFSAEVGGLSRRFDRSPRYYLTRCANPHLSRLARRGRWARWMRAATTLHRRLGVPYRWLLYRHGIGAFAPGAVVGWWRRLHGRSQATRRWINPAFARRVGLVRHKRVFDAGRNMAAQRTSRESHRDALLNAVFQYVFEVNDRTAAHLAVETRYPFCDRRLMDFCIAVPTDQQLRDGWTRFLLRRAMDGILPDEVGWRVHKQNLSPNAIRSLREKNRETVRDALRVSSPLAGYAKMKTLERVFDEFMNDTTWRGRHTDHAMILYQAATLGRWLTHRPFAVERTNIANRPATRAGLHCEAAVPAGH